MIVTADRESGEHRRVVDQIAELALWWINGQDDPPESIACLPAEERARRWAEVIAVEARQGGEFLRGLAELATTRKPPPAQTSVNGPTGPG